MARHTHNQPTGPAMSHTQTTVPIGVRVINEHNATINEYILPPMKASICNVMVFHIGKQQETQTTNERKV